MQSLTREPAHQEQGEYEVCREIAHSARRAFDCDVSEQSLLIKSEATTRSRREIALSARRALERDL
jgi:hypothetical protein